MTRQESCMTEIALFKGELVSAGRLPRGILTFGVVLTIIMYLYLTYQLLNFRNGNMLTPIESGGSPERARTSFIPPGFHHFEGVARGGSLSTYVQIQIPTYK